MRKNLKNVKVVILCGGLGTRLSEETKLKPKPMVNIGRPETKILSDNWTAVTRDKSLSAQFEHTIGITETGNEIFTLSENNTGFPINDL